MSQKLKTTAKSLRGFYDVMKESKDFECANLRLEFLENIHAVESFLDRKRDRKRNKTA